MKKRLIAVLLVAVMTVSLLCACKEEKKEPTAPAAPQGLTAEITLSCAAEGKKLDTLNAQIAKFMTDFPGIQVTLDAEGKVAEGEYPNVLCATPEEVVQYQKEDLLVSMDPWIDETGYVLTAQDQMLPIGFTDEERNDILEIYLEEGKQFGDGSTYMMPLSREVLAVYFNRTYFEENMMESPFTWELVEAACEQIKQANPEERPLACNAMEELFIAMCAQYGAEYTAEGGLAGLLDTDAARKALAKINEWHQKGYLADDHEAALGDKESNYYLVIDSSANAVAQQPMATNEAFEFELGVLNLPHPDEYESKIINWGHGLTIFNSGDDDQNLAAWMLVRYLSMDVEFQAQYAIAGSYLPVRSSVELNETFSSYLDSADGGDNTGALATLVCLEMQHKFFTMPVYENFATDKAVIGELVNSCATMTGDVEGQIQSAIEAALAT